MHKITGINPGLIVFLLSVLYVVSGNTQNDTPYPEGYLNDATRVDMSKAPDVFITKNGERTVTTSD